ncbi:MAG: hypothetical protein PVG34_11480 [Desulfobacterales bacterium]|jgi:hypothetical protein
MNTERSTEAGTNSGTKGRSNEYNDKARFLPAYCGGYWAKGYGYFQSLFNRFVECVATYQTLKKRLVEREATVTTSDARLHHLKRFRTRFEPLTDLRDELHIRVDTNMTLNESIRQILSHDHFSASLQIAELMNNRLSEVA